MEYTSLGRTGLAVSRICLGTMNFGVRTDAVEAAGILDEAATAGPGDHAAVRRRRTRLDPVGAKSHSLAMRDRE